MILYDPDASGVAVTTTNPLRGRIPRHRPDLGIALIMADLSPVFLFAARTIATLTRLRLAERVAVQAAQVEEDVYDGLTVSRHIKSLVLKFTVQHNFVLSYSSALSFPCRFLLFAPSRFCFHELHQ